MQFNSRLGRSILFVATTAILLARISAADASTIVPLTGGDPSGGLTLNASNVVVAQALSGNPTATVQGVSFNSLGPGVTFSFTDNRGDFSSSPNPVTFAGSDANDTALLSVINQGLQFSDTSGGLKVEINVGGLKPNTAYAADSIVTLYGNYNARSESIAYNGTTAVPLVSLTPNGVAYDVHSITTSTAGGNLVVDYNGIPGMGDGPVVTAFVLTAVTPEPSSFLLASAWALIGLFAAVRRRSKG